MMDPDEYDVDDALDRLTERISDEAVAQFKGERAESALRNVSPAVLRVREVIAEANRVRAVSPSATVLFAATAVEICLKKLILEPFIAGLIHNEDAAPLITTALVGSHALYRARQLAVELLKVAAGLDLEAHVRQGETLPFLSEAKALAGQRDAIAHRGEMATDKNAEHALLLADEMLNGVFAKLLWAFDLRMVRPDESSATARPPTAVIISTQGKGSGLIFVRT
ncbi:MAG: hypothetical protein K9G48_14250 [Reyranella sp.]|nr:hypothetical protein [Reyranella sp.]